MGPKEKPKSDPVDKLMRMAYGTAECGNVLANERVRNLQKTAEDLRIDTKKMVTHRRRNGWENQGKGFFKFCMSVVVLMNQASVNIRCGL